MEVTQPDHPLDRVKMHELEAMRRYLWYLRQASNITRPGPGGPPRAQFCVICCPGQRRLSCLARTTGLSQASA